MLLLSIYITLSFYPLPYSNYYALVELHKNSAKKCDNSPDYINSQKINKFY